MIYLIISKFKFSINIKNEKILFLLSINLIPIALMLAASILTGAQIRTMWMTPYLFFGTLFLSIFKIILILKKLTNSIMPLYFFLLYLLLFI